VVKRLGFLVDRLDVPIPEREERLDRWQEMLTQGISPLEPGAGMDGQIFTAWRIRVNIDGFSSKESQ
jgi:predicted transcriptional regulator of viral defense system